MKISKLKEKLQKIHFYLIEDGEKRAEYLKKYRYFYMYVKNKQKGNIT